MRGRGGDTASSSPAPPRSNPVDAFIDPEGYRAYIDKAEAELRSGRTH